MFSKIKIKLSSILKDHGYNVEPKIFSVPPKIEMGDLALPCFELAKSQKKNPVELAKEICAKVSDKRILRAEPIGPYVNFYFKPEYYNKEVLNHQVKFAPNSGKVMIEYSQPNTHKEFHIGHLRNAVLGSALVNLKRFCGQNILAVNYIGDTGVHVAKWLWWFFKKYQGVLPIEKTDVFGKIYTEATTELEKNPEFSVEVSLMHRILEKSIEKSFNNAELSDEEKNILETWQKTKSASLEYFKKIYQKLNIDFDLWFYESEEEVAGKKLISEILNSKKIPQIKKSEGAVIADLREFNLDVLVLIKSDGNALYGAKDLPLGIKKFKNLNVDESYYIVDKRQSLYLQQIFKLFDLLGFAEKKKKHIDYDFVTLPDGAMSSRKGNIVTFADLFAEVLAKSFAETKNRHADWSEEKLKMTAEKIALAGIKFFLLKYDNSSVIVFDIDKALAFEGDSGVYLLYVVSRINSILRKEKSSKFLLDLSVLTSLAERNLLRKIDDFAEVLQKANETDALNGLSTYLIELAQIFNNFYHECPVLTAEKKIKKARLRLCEKVKEIMTQGLNILNIGTLEEM